jgi:hypothetical protein
MTFSGDVADINAALQGMTFTPAAGFTGAASVTATVNETGFGNAPPSGTVPITIRGVPAQVANVAPAVSPAIGPQVPTTGVSVPDQTSGSTGGTTTPVATQAGGTSGGLFSNTQIDAPAAGPTPAPAAVPAAPPAAAPAPPAPAGPAPANPPAANPTAPPKSNPAPSTAAPASVPGNAPAPVVPDVLVQTQPDQVFTFLAPQGAMLKKMDSVKSEMASQTSLKVTAGTATGMSVGASAAYLIWLLRGGSLVSSLLSMFPAWKSIDPLPVLDSFEQSRRRRKKRKNVTTDDSDESLESLVDRSNQTAPGGEPAPAEMTRTLP